MNIIFTGPCVDLGHKFPGAASEYNNYVRGQPSRQTVSTVIIVCGIEAGVEIGRLPNGSVTVALVRCGAVSMCTLCPVMVARMMIKAGARQARGKDSTHARLSVSSIELGGGYMSLDTLFPVWGRPARTGHEPRAPRTARSVVSVDRLPPLTHVLGRLLFYSRAPRTRAQACRRRPRPV